MSAVRRFAFASALAVAAFSVAAEATAPPPSCPDAMGQPGKYNGFFFGPFTAPSSDVQGALAAQGNISLSNYSIGDQLGSAFSGASLLSGGNITFPSGRVYYGDIVAAGSAAGVGAPVRNGLAATQHVIDHAALPVDFVAELDSAKAWSAALAALPVNTTYESKYGGLNLHGDNASALQVFALPGNLVLASNNFTLDKVPANATVVLNISGASTGIKNVSVEAFTPMRTRVLYNFHQATSLQFAGIAVQGSVLAPLADVANPQGVIWGGIVAKSWNGKMQLNKVGFTGCGLPLYYPNHAPVATAQSQATDEDAALAVVLTATDADHDTLTFRVTTQPAHGTLSGAAPNLSYAPAANFNGSDAFAFVANDGKADSAPATVSLTIRAVNDAPVAQSQPSVTTAEGAAKPITLAATDVDSATLTYAVVANPAHGSLSGVAPNLTYTPAAGYHGADGFTFKANDGSLDSNVATVSLTITAVNHAPVATAQSLTLDQGASKSIVLGATDADGNTLTYAVVANPTHGLLSGVAPNLTYTPAAGYHGADGFTFKANDGSLDSNVASISLTIAAVNHAPVAQAQNVSVNEDGTLSIALAATDSDNDPLTYSIVSNPGHGTLSGAGATRVYTPASNFNGSDSFAFKASDGTVDSASAVVAISIAPVNDAPVAQDQTVVVDANGAAAISLAATDVDSADLAYAIVTPPVHGSLSGAAPHLSYTPNANYTGADSFSFKTSDGMLDSNVASVSITVRSVNQVPVAGAATVSVDEDSFTWILLGATDGDGDALTYSIVAPPQHGTIGGGSAPLRLYTPDANYHGADSFSFKASDGKDDSAPAIVTIDVASVNDAPVITSEPPTEVNALESYRYVATATDADGDALFFEPGGNPPGSSLDAATGVLTWTPTSSQVGWQAFSLAANDGKGGRTVQGWSVHVSPALNRDPVITSTPVETAVSGQAYAYDVDATDANGDPLAYALTAAPTGASIQPGSGAISWTPTSAQAGAQAFTVAVTDGRGGSATQSFTVTVGVPAQNHAPVIHSSPVLVATDGLPYVYDVDATDADGDVLAYSIAPLPSGLTIDAQTGAIRWTPTVAQRGRIDLTVSVADLRGGAATQAFTLTVAPSSDVAPHIVSAPPGAVAEGATLAYDVDATDVDAGDQLRYALAGAPLGATIDADHGMLAWAADPRWVGPSVARDAACQAPGSASQPYFDLTDWRVEYVDAFASSAAIWQVQPNDATTVEVLGNPPGSALVSPYWVESGSYEIALRSDGGDDDEIGFVWNYRDPMHYYALAFDGNNGNFLQIRRGYALWDGNQFQPATAVIAQVNRSWVVGMNYRITIDIRPGSAMIVVRDSSGIIAAIPVEDDTYVGGYLGFYDASQGNAYFRMRPAPRADAVDLAIDALAWNGSLVTASVLNRGLVGDASSVQVRVDGIDAQSGAVVRTLGTGAVAVPAPGARATIGFPLDTASLDFDAIRASVDTAHSLDECAEDNNERTVAAFSAVVTDLRGLSDRQGFSVQVDDVNQPPRFTSTPPVGVGSGRTLYYQPRATDPDLGDHVRFEVVSGPGGMAYFPSSGALLWTPKAADVGGRFPVELRAIDSSGASATQSFEIFVHHDPVITSAPVRTYTPTVANWQYQYDVDAIQQEGLALTYRLLSGPPGMTIDSTTGMISWRGPVQRNTDYVQIEVSDASGGRATQDYILFPYTAPSGSLTFTSTPGATAQRFQPYSYQVRTSSDVYPGAQFRLLEAPPSMLLSYTGLVTWTPGPVQFGDFVVVIEASNSFGQVATQRYTITVDFPADNTAPRITTTPSLTATPGAIYSYDVDSVDPDTNDARHYFLDVAPAGMVIDAESGLILWQPAASASGLFPVTVRVSDSHGGSDTQSFKIGIGQPGSLNHGPTIATSAVTGASAQSPYAYDVDATDSDGDTLTYALTTAPAGMTIDAATGAIAWTPTAAQVGNADVTVKVADPSGASATQRFTIAVGAAINHAPTIATVPPTTAKAGFEYRYDVDATDADHDALTYSLVVAPAGMTIDASTGLVRWTPSAAASNVPVKVRVADAQSAQDQTYAIDVVAANTALTAQLSATPQFVAANGEVSVTLAVTGAAGYPTAASTLDGAPVALAVNGTAHVSAATVGAHTIATSVTDGYTSANASATFYVVDPSDTAPPVVELITPLDGDKITAPTQVIGTVSDAHLASWQLVYRRAGAVNAEQVTLAQGTNTFTAANLAKFDPTQLINGQYLIILAATDQSGHQTTASAAVRVAGEMKVGNFSITFEDVSIPVAGIPVRVTRTYDTRQRNERLDFGKGWSVDYQNVRVSESRRLGYSWAIQTTRNGEVTTSCLEPNGDPLVTVTLPDGKVETFKAKAGTECSVGDVTTNQIVFEGIDNTFSRLEERDYGTVQLVGSNLVDIGDGQIVDPTRYRLTTVEGMVYELDQNLGISRIVEPNGNTLTYSASGIQHSTGIGVVFHRDAQGRIDNITLPDGKMLSYVYDDATGDLTTFADQLLQQTKFAYANPNAPHYLTDLTDARGVKVSRNEYDDNGRLVKTIDADGHEIVFGHDIDGRVETVRDRRGNLKTFVYDDQGRVLSETSNALGATTRHTYDPNGNELTRRDALGHTTTWTYDARNNKLTESNDLGPVSRSEYDARNALTKQFDATGRKVIENSYNGFTGALLSTTDALGHATSFGYDSGVGSGGSGELTSITDAASHTTSYLVNEKGWRTYETDAQGHSVSFGFDANGRVKLEIRHRTDAGGNDVALTTTHTYDDKGRVTRSDHPDGSFETTQYNAIDKPVKVCDKLDHCTTTTYDARGNVSRIDYADGSYETRSYDENGNVVASTDRGGRTTKMVYDADNRLVETIEPDATPATDADNPRTINAYDDAGRLVGSSDANGRTTTYGYDDAGRRTSVTDALHHTTTTHYDSAGRRDATTDALGRTTAFVYDAAGRLVETDFDDGSAAKVEFDALGRKTAEIDPANRRSEFVYDELGRLITVKLPNPATGAIDAGALLTSYTYDEQGNKLTQTDAEGRTTRWSYDDAGRELTRTLPLGQSESFGYDAIGNRVSHTDFNGKTTTFAYDSVGRLTTETFPDGEGTRTIGYTASGQRASVTDGSGTTTYTYDERDRLTRVVDADGRAVEYTYDANGNRTALITASQSMTYTFDALNRPDSVTATLGGGTPLTTRYAYDAVGNRSAMLRANGTTTEYGYSRLNRLTSLAHKAAAGALLFGAAYGVDASGLRTSAEESDASGVARTVAYAYDGVKRLTSETIVARDPANNRSTSWTYDKVGNRLTQSSVVGATSVATTSYAYDANDRLQTESGASSATYTYDNNGNTLGKASGGNTITYRYTSENRLAEMSAGGNRTTYAYDGDGLRIGQTLIPQTGASVTTRYTLDKNRAYAQVIEEREVSGGATKLVQLNTFADDLVSQGRCGGASTAIDCSDAATSYRMADGMDSTRLLTDAAGTATDSFAFDAFGNDIGRTGSTPTEHLYRGEQFDPNLGFYNLRARWMDPKSARFLNSDDFGGRAGDPPSLHKYLYANADPVNRMDPGGHESLISVSMAINIVGIGSTVIHAGFKLAEGDYEGAAWEVGRDTAAWFLGAGVGKLIPTLTKPLVGLINRAIHNFDNSLLLYGLPHSSQILTYNMERLAAKIGFGGKPAGWQAHHIVGEAFPEGRAAVDLLTKKFHIDINSPLNGVYLPGCGYQGSAGVVGLAVHCGLHTQEYARLILRELSQAKDEMDAINVLNRIREELTEGALTLNRRGNL